LVPHGVIVHFWTLLLNELKLTKAPIILGARFLYQIPIVRELFLLTSIEGNLENVEQIFQHGRSCVVVPGGVPEMIKTKPGNTIIVNCHNKGFIKIALQHGVSIVPIFAFGENNEWEQLQIPSKISMMIQKVTGGMYPVIPWGSWGPLLPKQIPIVQCIGKPVEMPKIFKPTKQQVTYYHERFYKSVSDLIRSTQKQAGYSNTKVEFDGLSHLSVLDNDDESQPIPKIFYDSLLCGREVRAHL
jgi:hypothetical protein